MGFSGECKDIEVLISFRVNAIKGARGDESFGKMIHYISSRKLFIDWISGLTEERTASRVVSE